MMMKFKKLATLFQSEERVCITCSKECGELYVCISNPRYVLCKRCKEKVEDEEFRKFIEEEIKSKRI